LARFLADENFPFSVTEVLRRLGDDVVTLGDLGKAGQALTDQTVLDRAQLPSKVAVGKVAVGKDAPKGAASTRDSIVQPPRCRRQTLYQSLRGGFLLGLSARAFS
jgi:hypothetical protein